MEDVSRALQQLNALIDEILFSNQAWPCDAFAVSRKLDDFGLTTGTRLGAAVELDLFLVFLGLWEESEIPLVLEPHSLLSRAESVFLWDGLEVGQDMSAWLRPRLQRAYRQHFHQLQSS